ncbi:MAG TPA: universal stress protein [Dissulfurispiraceae bacterium]|nr:universal stress protein [Dissulfurispiraceae bacterium]
MKMKNILLCTDGEEQTKKAEEYALTISRGTGASVTALYVVDPFLKKFTNEIYAVNRDECREHLDKCLQAEGKAAISAFAARAAEAAVAADVLVRFGDPAEEILKEIDEHQYAMVIMGSKVLKGWKERFESFKLSEKVFKKCPIPLLVVR